MSLEEAMAYYRQLDRHGRADLWRAVAAHGPTADGCCAACAIDGVRRYCPCPVYEGWAKAISLVRHVENGHPLTLPSGHRPARGR